MSNRPAFASGQKIGRRATRAWICTICGMWFDAKPAKQTQCRGSGVKAHPTVAQHFPSHAEAGYYMELRTLQAAGKIGEIECQPKFPLIVNGATLGKYIADFSFIRPGKTEREFIDVKGNAQTELSQWKRTHAEAQYGIKINIVRR